MVKMIDNYALNEEIGQGNYGKVYRAKHLKKQGQFAVKVIPVEKFHQNNKLQECTINQVQTLSAIGNSDHIVRYYEMLKTKNNYYFVYEYCNGGTLLQAIRNQGHFSQKKSLGILKELLQAFKVLNRFNIMHRDLKPQNVFFNDGKVKLGDFGFCKGLKPEQNMAKTMLGSPIYMAPQVLRGQAYTTKADIWSLGVILYEMLFGHCPFQSNSIAMLINTITSSELQLPLEINQVSQKTQTLIKKMLMKDYFRRISWVELFGTKIQLEGEDLMYTSGEIVLPKSSLSLNKSYSVIKEPSAYLIANQKNKVQTPTISNVKKPASVPKNDLDRKNKFYSQKYMNVFLQGIDTDKKIGSVVMRLEDESFTKGDEREERRQSIEKTMEREKDMEKSRESENEKENQRMRQREKERNRARDREEEREKQRERERQKQKHRQKDRQVEKLKILNEISPATFEQVKTVSQIQTKRQKLLKKHEECLNLIKSTLLSLQTRTLPAISYSYITLKNVHEKLKQITEDIRITETDLLDVASLINYQIIQIDRQMIETRQELMRRKMDVPRVEGVPVISSIPVGSTVRSQMGLVQ